jgi:hypothetical protein
MPALRDGESGGCWFPRVSPVARFMASLREAPGVRLPDGRRKVPMMWRAVWLRAFPPFRDEAAEGWGTHFIGR